MTRSALGWLNLILPKDRVGRVETNIAYGTHARHKLDVYYPHNCPERAPMLVFFYGGGWSDGARADYGFAARAFAAQGFITLVPDYRLVPEVHYPDFLIDLGQVLQWVVQHGADISGDVTRLFFMGHSAGAYNAMMLGLDGQRYGAPDLTGKLRGVVGISGPYDFYPFDVAASINAFSQAAHPEATQPVNLVGPNAPPIMLAHGKPDTICGLYNAQNLAAKYRETSGDVTAHYYDGIGHAGTLLALFPWLRWRAPVFQNAIEFMRARL